MNEASERARVAIACQGGGSHTAFTAGALRGLLATDAEIVALSGTSGGAICALLAWYGILQGDRDAGARLLESFWREISARSPWERVANDLSLAAARVVGYVAAPELNPYLYPERAQDRLREVVERHVDFARVPALLAPASPLLLVSAVEVRTGEFRIFRDAEVTVEAVLASAAVPTLFRAVHLNGGVYWDGLFSQNPPVRDLARAKPDEIWVIQINPTARAEEPRAIAAIRDRRNELAGNISLEQELFFIETINRLVAEGHFSGDGYRQIDVRRIEFERDLDFESKLDRRPEFIAELIADGERRAERFLAERPAPGS